MRLGPNNENCCNDFRPCCAVASLRDCQSNCCTHSHLFYNVSKAEFSKVRHITSFFVSFSFLLFVLFIILLIKHRFLVVLHFSMTYNSLCLIKSTVNVQQVLCGGDRIQMKIKTMPFLLPRQEPFDLSIYLHLKS